MLSAQELRESVFDTQTQTRNRAFIGYSYPELKIRCDRQYSASSKYLVAEALLEFRDLCETELLVLDVGDGCIKIDIGLMAPHDAWNRDFRKLFYSDRRYHAFNCAYDVHKVFFHRFPSAGNYETVMNFDKTGRPAILAR